MSQPAYPAARAAAVRVHSHYAIPDVDTIEATIDVKTIEVMIDVAFWASLRREEIYTPRISLAFVAPSQVDKPLNFEHPVAFAAQPLTRLGPAVERPGIHLCVWRDQGELFVWGAARALPPSCFVLEVVGPGLLVIKRSRGDESGKFVNLAVIQGDEIKIIDQHAAAAPGLVSLLIKLAVSMRAHGRGGSLLVVPSESSVWRESILHPVMYSVAPAFRALVDLMDERPEERAGRRWQEALYRAVDGIAGLTAVDGATIITDRYELLAFGAKIVPRLGFDQVASVLVSEPIEGSPAAIAEPGQLGGTRHLSAAQFAHDQRDAIALIASQDGRFTVFRWSPTEEMVQANRIDALLL